MAFTMPVFLRTGPSLLLSLVQNTTAGDPVVTVHNSSTVVPFRTSTVAGVDTVGGSKTKKR